jgi:hypothetical protein
VQAVHPFRVVAPHGIPERLPLHARQPRRLGPREAFERVGDRQQPHRGTPVPLEAGQTAKLGSGQALADGEGGHGRSSSDHPANSAFLPQPASSNFRGPV